MSNLTDSPPPAAMPPPRRSGVARWALWFSLGGIALVGGIASYLRAKGVIEAVDGRSVMSWLEAGLADPTIAAASINIADAQAQDDDLPWLSIVSITVAAVVTLGANVVYGSPDPLPKWLVNVWPPVAFMLALESLMSYLKRGRAAPPMSGAATPPHDPPCPHGVAANVDDAVRLAYEHERDCEGAAPTFVALAARFGLDRKRVADLVKPPAPPPADRSAP